MAASRFPQEMGKRRKKEKMYRVPLIICMVVNWDVIISAGMVVLGGVLSHQLAAWRDRANKRCEYRVGYLIKVFRGLRKLSHKKQENVPLATDELDKLLSDIQFLGNDAQIKAALKLGEQMVKERAADLGPLMTALRNELRRELGMPRTKEPIKRLKTSKKSKA